MWPATPSAKPAFAKMRKASASRCFRYLRSWYLSSKVGGPLGTPAGIVRLGSPLLYVEAWIAGIFSVALAGILKA